MGRDGSVGRGCNKALVVAVKWGFGGCYYQYPHFITFFFPLNSAFLFRILFLSLLGCLSLLVINLLRVVGFSLLICFFCFCCFPISFLSGLFLHACIAVDISLATAVEGLVPVILLPTYI